MADFDAIVVGSGCAGAVAAYELAQAGKSVLVVERGNFAGAKNMTGGRIYSHSLKKVFPDFEQEAPLERKITHERMAFMDPTSQMAIDFTSPELAEEAKDSYSVLRAPFDQWLASKAEDAGAEYICGIAVEELLKDESGKVVGVRAGEDEITAEVTIVAEGVNSLLCERSLSPAKASPDGVGIKQVFELPRARSRTLSSCPRVKAQPCCSWATAHGNVGGLPVRTRTPISLGLVATIAGRRRLQRGRSADARGLPEPPRPWLHHPRARLVGALRTWCPGGYDMVPQYVFDGALVAGETAGLCMNMGYQVRGMDFAVASGQMAGLAAVKALDAGDTSAAGLSSYKTAMENSFVIQDLATFRKWPHTMEGWSSMFTDYPVMVKEIFNAMFSVDGEPQKPLMKRMMPIVKKRGLFKLAGEVRKAVKSL